MGMTREEAIKILDNEKPCCGEKIAYTEGERSAAYDMAIAALREQGNCCKNGNSSWISVADRLPPPYVEVLAYRKNFSREGGFVTMEHLFLWHGESLVWNNNSTTWRSKVTHWMPLPEPPEVG